MEAWYEAWDGNMKHEAWKHETWKHGNMKHGSMSMRHGYEA
jgi:hypothetical protein